MAAAKEAMSSEISAHFRGLYESEFAVEQQRRVQIEQQFRGDMEHRLQEGYLMVEAEARKEIDGIRSRSDEAANAMRLDMVSVNATALRQEAMCAEESRVAAMSRQRLRVAESAYGDADALLRDELDSEFLTATKRGEQVVELQRRCQYEENQLKDANAFSEEFDAEANECIAALTHEVREANSKVFQQEARFAEVEARLHVGEERRQNLDRLPQAPDHNNQPCYPATSALTLSLRMQGSSSVHKGPIHSHAFRPQAEPLSHTVPSRLIAPAASISPSLGSWCRIDDARSGSGVVSEISLDMGIVSRCLCREK